MSLWFPTPAIIRPSWRGANGLYAARKLGIASGIKLCLDAGDAGSYPGTGQPWIDLVGNYDFNRGATNGAEASDPTFNGNAGQLTASEYASFDGGDYFRKASANDVFFNSLHKDNALWSMCCWWRTANASGTNRFFGTSTQSASLIGIAWNCNSSTATMTFVCSNGSGTAARTQSPNLGVTDGVWQFFALSWDEAANTSNYHRNAVGTGSVASYSSPSASDASYTAEIGAFGNAIGPSGNGCRLGLFMMWDRYVPAAQMTALYQATRGRYGV